MAYPPRLHVGFGLPLSVVKGIAPHKELTSPRRQISPRAGHALVILGHAIEYLTDEFLLEFERSTHAWRTGRIQAIQVLMSSNRLIYLECPEVPTLRERIRALLHMG